MGAFIVTSRRGGVRALSSSRGTFATDCHAQLHALLARRLGADHAALLAEPQHAPDCLSTDWYADGEGAVIPVASLPQDEAARLRARAEELAGDIRELALGMTGDGDAGRNGELLLLALKHPGEDDLWSVNGRPTLVRWGFLPASAEADPQELGRSGAARRPKKNIGETTAGADDNPAKTVSSASACNGADDGAFENRPASGGEHGNRSASERRRMEFWRPGCLLPLLLLLLLIWLLAVLLGIAQLPLPAGCSPVPPSQAGLNALEAERATLENEIIRLHAELGQRADMCRRAPAPSTPGAIPPERVPGPRSGAGIPFSGDGGSTFRGGDPLPFSGDATAPGGGGSGSGDGGGSGGAGTDGLRGNDGDPPPVSDDASMPGGTGGADGGRPGGGAGPGAGDPLPFFGDASAPGEAGGGSGGRSGGGTGGGSDGSGGSGDGGGGQAPRERPERRIALKFQAMRKICHSWTAAGWRRI